MMVGVRLTERETGDEYVVVGQDAGQWIVARVEFGSPQVMPTASLASRFDVDEPEHPSQPDEAAGWHALADANDAGALKLARGDVGGVRPSPEAQFAEAARIQPRPRGRR